MFTNRPTNFRYLIRVLGLKTKYHVYNIVYARPESAQHFNIILQEEEKFFYQLTLIELIEIKVTAKNVKKEKIRQRQLSDIITLV